MKWPLSCDKVYLTKATGIRIKYKNTKNAQIQIFPKLLEMSKTRNTVYRSDTDQFTDQNHYFQIRKNY